MFTPGIHTAPPGSGGLRLNDNERTSGMSAPPEALHSHRVRSLRPAPRGKIVVSGILFWYPLAGVTYQFLHYLIGLRRLGYDPYYIEDSGRWIYDPLINDLSGDATGNIAAVAPI